MRKLGGREGYLGDAMQFKLQRNYATEIPAFDFKEFKNDTSLPIVDIPFGIHAIRIPGNAYAELKKQEKLVALTTIFADGFREQQARDIVGLKKLKMLALPHSKFIDSAIVETLADLKELTHLDLHETSVDDKAIDTIVKFENLTRLDLRWTKVTNKGVMSLLKLKKLRVLHIDPETMDDEFIQTMAKEDMLGILGNLSTGRELSVFKPEDVTRINLEWAGISDSGFKEFERFSNAIEVVLKKTQVTNQSLAVLSKFKKLERLDVSGTRVDVVKGMDEILAVKSLKSLLIEPKQITPENLNLFLKSDLINRLNFVSLMGVGKTVEEKVTRLDLSESGFRDEDLRELERFKNLNTLTVSTIGRGGLETVAKLPKLESLWILPTDNITDEVVKNLSELGILYKLQLCSTGAAAATKDQDIKFSASSPAPVSLASVVFAFPKKLFGELSCFSSRFVFDE